MNVRIVNFNVGLTEESTPLSSFRQRLFTCRSYTPIPFLVVMVVFAQPTLLSLGIGAVLTACGELLRLWGVAHAGCLTRVTGSVGAPSLVVSGPYAYMRNPLYVGNIAMYVGIGIASNALFPWLVLIAFSFFAVQYALIVSLEEEFLVKTFGTHYEEYRMNVPRFLPRRTPYRPLAQERSSIEPGGAKADGFGKLESRPAVANARPDWRTAFRSDRRTFQALVLVWLTLLAIRFWS